MINNGDGTFTIKNKTTGQTKTVSSAELPKYGLFAPVKQVNKVDKNTVGAFENAVGETGIFDVPVLGGALRAVAHPALRGAEMVGQAVGETGAALTGQATAPDIMSKDSLKKIENRDVGSVATEGVKTAAGVASYAVPGGGFTGSVTKKGLAGAGALSGFSESGETVGETVGETLVGGVGGLAAAKVPGLVSKIAGKSGEAIFEKIPARLRSKIDRTEKELMGLEQRKMTDMVGYKNISKAKTLGITPESMPEDVVRVVTPELESVGTKLNNALGQDYASATMAEVRDAFRKASKQVAPGVKGIDLEDWIGRNDEFLRQNISDEIGQVGAEMTPGQRIDFMNDEYPINLNIVNKIKQRLGDRFEDDPLYKQAYKNLQELIEKNSGDPDGIKALNQEYNSLREIRNQSQQQIDKGLSRNIEDYQLKREQIKGNPLNDPYVGTAAGLGAVMGSVLGPVGAVPGGTFAMYRVLNSLMKNPEVARTIANALEAPKNTLRTPVGKVVSKGADMSSKAIGKLLEQAGVRLPSSL